MGASDFCKTKTHKMAAGRLGNVLSPPVGVRRQNHQKNVLFIKHSKTGIIRVKIQ